MKPFWCRLRRRWYSRSTVWPVLLLTLILQVQGDFTVIYSTLGLRQQGQNRSSRGLQERRKTQRRDWGGRHRHEGWVRADDAWPTAHSRTSRGGQMTKQEAACREHLSLSQGQSLREAAVSHLSFRTYFSQGAHSLFSMWCIWIPWGSFTMQILIQSSEMRPRLGFCKTSGWYWCCWYRYRCNAAELQANPERGKADN